MPRYHYNQASELCELFVYGGCGGTENNFQNIGDCIKTCGAKNSKKKPGEIFSVE
jgi:hypothetical protein